MSLLPPKDKNSPVTVQGDPFGTRKEAKEDSEAPSPGDVKKIHTNADTDSSQQAAHHTLGIKHDQGSPGDHKHDGKSSRRLMEGVSVTGSKGGNVALANLITALSSSLGFTDNTT